MTTIVLGQMRCEVGDLHGNAQRMEALALRAIAEQGADLIAFPELSLTGYPPEDLLLNAGFVAEAKAALWALAARVDGIDMLVGLPWAEGGQLFNAAAWVHGRQVVGLYRKWLLPNYGVFDERRYFASGDTVLVRSVGDLPVGVTICEDLWEPGPARATAEAGARVLINMNASPYHRGKDLIRLETGRARIAETGLAVAYVNMVGAQDELVFDGASFVLGRDGRVAVRGHAFEEDLVAARFDLEGRPQDGDQRVWPAPIAGVYRALTLGLREYVQKNGFEEVVLGLSGGVDSALVLTLCCDAFVADRVQAVMMPSRYTLPMSIEDAQIQADKAGVRLTMAPIGAIYEAFAQTLDGHWQGPGHDLATENLQARIRGTLLMALANARRGLVVVTSNKSELAVGYTTLYGDMAGGYAPLKDVFKTDVYALAHYRNALSEAIPERVLIRPPTAELRFDQKDTDSLPPYDLLDAILLRIVEENCGRQELLACGYDPLIVDHVLNLVRLAEHKRKQAPLGTRVSARAFGRDWRYPVSARYGVGKM